MLLRLIFPAGLAKLMSYPPALSDLTLAPQSSNRRFASDRTEGNMSAGQQCGELIGTSNSLNPARLSSAIASIAECDHRYENVEINIWQSPAMKYGF
jgi:hypothetical protein